MSKISIHPDYDGQLWTKHERGKHKVFTHSWGKNEVTFSDGGFSIVRDVELAIDDQEALVRDLINENQPTWPGHFQNTDPSIRRVIQRIEHELWSVVIQVDHQFRKFPKGIRLSTPRMQQVPIPGGVQSFPAVRWIFDDQERERLRPLYAHISEEGKRHYDKGIYIPMPMALERRQIELDDQEVASIFDELDSDHKIPAFWRLYGVGWQNLNERNFDSAVLTLATSLETSFKHFLVGHSDSISLYLIENIQSPPLEKLYELIRNEVKPNLPGEYIGWIAKLRKARNDIAHKPGTQIFELLEIVRWFAIVEAVFKILNGSQSHKHVGKLVQPDGNVSEKFPRNTFGIILREEELYDEVSYHIVVDSGETHRFGSNAIQICSEQDVAKAKEKA